MPLAGARVVAIDAIRGLAMFFSCLGHFAGWLTDGYPQLAALLMRCGKIGTPLFLVLSGAMIGFVQLRAERVANGSRTALLDRGLFILIVGHCAIALIGGSRHQDLRSTLLSSFTTDAIGLACIFAALLPARVALRFLPTIGALSFLLSWLIALSWHPTNHAIVVTKQLLVGQPSGDVPVTYGPVALVPDIAICIMGIALGQLWTRQLTAQAGFATAGRWLVRFGFAAAVTAVALWALRYTVDFSGRPDCARALTLTFSIYQKMPPSPSYLLFYAGCGLALGGLVMLCWERRYLITLLRILAEVGRASLFVFIAQFFVIWTLVDTLGLTPNRYSGLLFFVELLLLWQLARWWNFIGGNRYYSVRLARKAG